MRRIGGGERYCPPPHARLSWAQEGEDLILDELFRRVAPKSQFYVDVGAHHPQRFSNTWLFYQRGWRGINLDPVPGFKRLFAESRPRDVNIEAAVVDRPGTVTLFLFDERALSTHSRQVAEQRQTGGRYRIETTIDVPAVTLSEVLERHLPVGCSVDFLSIDVEGSELLVVRSLDWTRWRPGVVLVESLDPAGPNDVETARLLHDVGYVEVSRTPRTRFFMDSALMGS